MPFPYASSRHTKRTDDQRQSARQGRASLRPIARPLVPAHSLRCIFHLSTLPPQPAGNPFPARRLALPVPTRCAPPRTSILQLSVLALSGEQFLTLGTALPPHVHRRPRAAPRPRALIRCPARERTSDPRRRILVPPTGSSIGLEFNAAAPCSGRCPALLQPPDDGRPFHLVHVLTVTCLSRSRRLRHVLHPKTRNVRTDVASSTHLSI